MSVLLGSLTHSRKFWLATCATLVSLAVYAWAQNALLVLAIQLAFVSNIVSIAIEDAGISISDSRVKVGRDLIGRDKSQMS